jgi:hypothetical protein
MVGSSLGLALSQLQAKVPALAAQSSWGEVLGFLALGVSIVLTALAGLSLLTTATGFVFQRRDRAGRKPAAPGIVPVPEADPEGSRAPFGDPLLPAVIAVAVATVLHDQAFRVLRVAPAPGPPEPNSWGGEGRRQIFDSHAYSQRGAVRSLRPPTGRARVPKRRPIPKKHR